MTTLTRDSQCKKCGGNGWVRVVEELDRQYNATGKYEVIPLEMSDGEEMAKYPYPQWSHSVVECPCIRRSRAAKRVQMVIDEGWVDRDAITFDFSDFDNEHSIYAATLCHQLTSYGSASAPLSEGGDPVKRPGVLLCGEVGSGKTSLAFVSFRKWLAAGTDAQWIKWPVFIDEIRETYEPNYGGNNTPMSLRDQIMRVPALVIDELGSVTRAERGGKNGSILFAEDALTALMFIADARYNLSLPTIITSNLDEDQLEQQFGKPIMSRLRGLYHLAPLTGVDLREGATA